MAKKTRIVIQAGEQLSELFSVRERSNGDLVLLAKPGMEIGDDLSDDYQGLQEDRTSIHLSPNSPSNTFVQHVRTEDGRYQRRYASVLPFAGRLRWVISGQVGPDFSDPRYASSASASDTHVSIGRYNPQYSTLAYLIVVTNPGQRLRPPHSLNGRSLRFREFDLHVLWCFMRIPSFPQGSTFYPITGWTDQKPEGTHERKPVLVNSLGGQELADLIRNALKAAGQMQKARFFRFAEKHWSGEDLTPFNHPLLFHFVQHPEGPIE